MEAKVFRYDVAKAVAEALGFDVGDMFEKSIVDSTKIENAAVEYFVAIVNGDIVLSGESAEKVAGII